MAGFTDLVDTGDIEKKKSRMTPRYFLLYYEKLSNIKVPIIMFLDFLYFCYLDSIVLNILP